MIKCLTAGVLALACAAPAAASPMTLPLTAGNMLAQTHSHAIIMTVTGTYKQLSGTLNFDPDAKTCAIDVTFIVRSLTSPNALMRSQTMSKEFLDPNDYPTTRYVGACQGDMLVGNLTMRGQTRPFSMAISYQMEGGKLTQIHTEGTLNRYDWGLSGLSMTVGKTIRVTNDISVTGQPPTAN